MDKALYIWFVQCKGLGVPVPITRPILKENALTFNRIMGSANFTASNDWLSHRKKFHSVHQFTITKKSADEKVTEKFQNTFRK